MEINCKHLIFICIPNLGEMSPKLTERLLYWQQKHSREYNLKFYFPGGMLPLDNARNHCVNEFMKISKYEDDRLWFIDADIIPPFNALEVLMKHDKDICGLLCFMMKPDDRGQIVPLPIAMRYNIEKKYQVYFDGSGLAEVDALGGGCIMSKRKVFETIGGRCFEFHYYPDGTLSLVGDYDYCQKAQRAGFKIWVDFNNLCSHIKAIDLFAINNLMVKILNEK